jgi:hypothetical protein
MPEIHKELALSGMNNENLYGVTSKATILARSVCGTLVYFTRNEKWLLMKYMVWLICIKDILNQKTFFIV